MNHLAVSYVNSHMSTVAYNIARLGVADCDAASALSAGCPWERDSGNGITVLYKPGAVKTYAWRCSAVNIGDSKLAIGCIHDCLSCRGVPTGRFG